LARAGDL